MCYKYFTVKGFQHYSGERGQNLSKAISMSVNCWFLALTSRKEQEPRQVSHSSAQDCRSIISLTLSKSYSMEKKNRFQKVLVNIVHR